MFIQDGAVSMISTYNKYATKNILRELKIIEIQIETLPDSIKKEVAQVKVVELRAIIQAIKEEEKTND